jgi:hypothetical protein
MTLEETLDALDAVVQSTSRALQAADAPALEQSSGRLRDAMVAFASIAQRFTASDWSPQSKERAQKIGEQMTLLRSQLARLNVVTQRQVAALVPQPPQADTYGRGGVPTASNGQSVARMYHITG